MKKPPEDVTLLKKYGCALSQPTGRPGITHVVLQGGHQVWVGDHHPTDSELLHSLLVEARDTLRKRERLVEQAAEEIEGLLAELNTRGGAD